MKTQHDSNHYVYAYFDPRNYEMFYVGKGKGSRKNAHRPDKVGTEKERQIHDIERAGLKPLIRIVAADLTDEQALLVEKSLIWRSGKWLTNLSSGHFADNFRPPNTLHISLPGFDTARGIYAVNVSLWEHRHWDDSRKFGFLAAGYGRKHSNTLERLEPGDIVAAYLGRKNSTGLGINGYVGIGRVIERTVRVNEFRINGHLISPRKLQGKDLFHHANNANRCEYLVKVEWIKTLPAHEAHFLRNAGLFAPRPIVASLSGQPKTLKYIEQQFKVRFDKLLAAE